MKHSHIRITQEGRKTGKRNLALESIWDQEFLRFERFGDSDPFDDGSPAVLITAQPKFGLKTEEV